LLEDHGVTRVLENPADLGGERRIRAGPADEEIQWPLSPSLEPTAAFLNPSRP
jgi:hypothetical protein